jgi:hypothetical protein
VKAIYFSAEITDDSTAKLLKDIDTVEAPEPVVVYLCSNGGDASNAEVIADYVNRLGPERFTFSIAWNCSSAALDLLCALRCPIEIGAHALATLHLYSNDVALRELANKHSTSTFLQSSVARRNEAFLREVQIGGIEGEELDEIAKGNDIIISGSRITDYIERVRNYRAKGAGK